jgi:RuvA, C-terminal domain
LIGSNVGSTTRRDPTPSTLGFRAPEVRRALATLQAKVDAAVMPAETVLREALRLLT